MCQSTTPPSDRDFPVEISAVDIRRIKAGLAEIAKTSFPSTELALTIASLAAGGVIGALQAGVGASSSPAWWLSYLVLPPTAVGGAVAYFMLKRISVTIPAARAKALLEVLGDGRSRPLDTLAGRWEMTSSTKTSGKTSTGSLNIEVIQGRASAAGIMYGESTQPIAQITAEVCDYRETTHQFVLVYLLSAINDNGGQILARCIFDGVVFDLEAEPKIRGSWFHLEGDEAGGRPWGHATLVRVR